MSSDPSIPRRLRLQIIIATENAEGQTTDLRKFLHITQREKDISVLANEVNEKFKSLYPAERPITILRIQDDSGCDLDFAYQLVDVFEERGVARVIISDDGLGPRRLFSPAASKISRLHTNDFARRESFDSVTGYVTPSVSSLNTASPLLHNRVNRNNPDDLRNRNDQVEQSPTPLTEDALSKMQIERSGKSPEIPSDHPPNEFAPPSSSQRKRKRSSDMEVPESPDKAARLGKKRALSKKSDNAHETSELQDPKIPETPEKDRKLRASPTEASDPGKKSRGKKKGVGASEESEYAMQIDSRELPPKARPEVVIFTSAGGAKKSRATNNSLENKGDKEKEDDPNPKPQLQDEKVTKKRTTLRTAQSKKEAPDNSSSIQPVTATVATRTDAQIKGAVSKTTKAKKADNAVSVTGKESTTQDTKVKGIQKKTPTLDVTIVRGKGAVKSGSKLSSASNEPVSSPTSPSSSSQRDSDEDLESSATSSSASSASESSDESDESDDDESEESPDESDSDEKMDVDSIDEKVETARKNPEVSKRRSISPIGKQSTSKSSQIAPTLTESKDKDVSRSASPATSSSGSSSDSSSSDSESSASDSESGSDDNEASAVASETSDSESDSDESTSSKSSSASSSRASSKSRSPSPASTGSKSRSASPTSNASNASTAKSSARDGNSSSSSNLVAISLGGSAQKSRPKDPILHRTTLSQNTDGSPNDMSLSQRSPLAMVGRSDSRLNKYSSLTDLARKMKENRPTVVENKQSNDESESEGESSDSSSDSVSDSDQESEKEENGIPKAKLAGRAPVAQKKKSGSLRSMFK